MGKRGREYRVRVTVPMSSSQTEALFPRRLSSRSQVSGRGSFIRFPALLESHGPGRRLRENICRLEGYLGQKRESLPFHSQLKITQKRSVSQSQSVVPATNVAGIGTTRSGAMEAEKPRGYPGGRRVRGASSHL